MSAEPDHIDASVTSQNAAATDLPVAGQRFRAFTDEKAKVLHKEMLQTGIYHDAMYHSTIASGLEEKVKLLGNWKLVKTRKF